MPAPSELIQAAMMASRRRFLSNFGMGMGGIGLATLLGSELQGAESSTDETSAVLAYRGRTFRPRPSACCTSSPRVLLRT